MHSICLEQLVKSASLAMHSNIIRELQNNSLITKYKLSILLMHSNSNCMAPGFLEIAQHQLVKFLIDLSSSFVTAQSQML